MNKQLLSRIVFAMLFVTISAPAQAVSFAPVANFADDIKVGVMTYADILARSAKNGVLNGSAATKKFVVETTQKAIDNKIYSIPAAVITALAIGTAVYFYQQNKDKKADKKQSNVTKFCKDNRKALAIGGSVATATVLAGLGIKKYGIPAFKSLANAAISIC